MTKSTLGLSSIQTSKNLLVGLCGFATSILTAFILWWVEVQFGFAFYTWMFWFVIPIGALLSGFAGASGYYFGSLYFGHRPTRRLLLNIIVASISTFFLVYYLSYITLKIEGKSVSDYISFIKYIDITVRSMEYRFRGSEVGSTGELGKFGYIVALLQIVGFAVGGFAVYSYLVSKPYCEKCSQYLSGKGKRLRYTGNTEEMQAATAKIVGNINNGDIASAIDLHKTFGNSTPQKDDYLRLILELRHCEKCSQHWVRFSAEKYSSKDWKEISDLTVAAFTNQVVEM
jgi:hypothetical protein